MSSRRLIVPLLLLLAVAFSGFAGEPNTIAAPLEGPMPYVSGASAAFGPDGGVAVWTTSGSVWGVPLDFAGVPQQPARNIVRLGNVHVWSRICHGGGAFRLWVNSSSRGISVARLDDQLRAVGTRELPPGTPLPTACGSELALAFPDFFRDPLAVQFIDYDTGETRRVALPLTGSARGRTAVALDDGSFAVLISTTSGLFLVRFTAAGEMQGPPIRIEGAEPGTIATPPLGHVATDGASLAVFSIVGSVLKTTILRPDGSIKQAADVETGPVDLLGAAGADGVYTAFFSPGAGSSSAYASVEATRVGGTESRDDSIERILESADGLRIAEIATSGDRHHLFFFPAELPGSGRTAVLHRVSVPTTGPFARPDPADPGTVLTTSAAWQGNAVAAGGDLGWMTAWIERTADSHYLRVAAVEAGSTVPSEPITRRLDGWLHAPPEIEFDGLDFIVAWVENDLLRAWRIRRDGAPFTPEPVTLTSGVASFPGIMGFAAKSGTAYFAWHTENEVWGAMLYGSALASAPVRISPPSHTEDQSLFSYSDPVVSASADGFLVAWTEWKRPICHFPMCTSEAAVQGQRVARSGAPVEPLFDWDGFVALSAAGGDDRHLLSFFDGSVTVVGPAGASAPVALPFYRGGAEALAGDGEFLVGYWPTSGTQPFVSHVSMDGEILKTEQLGVFEVPSAIDGRNVLLSIGSIPIDEPPYHGAPAVAVEESGPLDPGPRPPRRRAARR